jgi:hypothetical protein
MTRDLEAIREAARRIAREQSSSGREWEEILRLRRSLDEDERRRAAIEEEAQRQRNLEAQRIRREGERIAEERRRQEEAHRQQELALVNSAARQMQRIFNDLATKDQSINKFPLRKIDITNSDSTHYIRAAVDLRWGNKFDYTEQERAIIRDYDYKPALGGILEGLFYPQIPESIMQYEFYSLSSSVTPSDITIGSISRPTQEFIQTPGILNEAIAQGLRSPSLSRYVLIKGTDYWKDRPKYSGSSSSSSSSDSSYDGCCCNVGY